VIPCCDKYDKIRDTDAIDGKKYERTVELTHITLFDWEKKHIL
jgi:hypothetical protein